MMEPPLTEAKLVVADRLTETVEIGIAAGMCVDLDESRDGIGGDGTDTREKGISQSDGPATTNSRYIGDAPRHAEVVSVLEARRDFQLTELLRFETAGGFEQRPKLLKLTRRQSFQDLDAFGQHTENAVDTIENVSGFFQGSGRQPPHDEMQLVEKLLEP